MQHTLTQPDLLTPTQAAQKLNVSIRTLWRLVATGALPNPIRFSRRLVRFRIADIEAVIK